MAFKKMHADIWFGTNGTHYNSTDSPKSCKYHHHESRQCYSSDQMGDWLKDSILSRKLKYFRYTEPHNGLEKTTMGGLGRPARRGTQDIKDTLDVKVREQLARRSDDESDFLHIIYYIMLMMRPLISTVLVYFCEKTNIKNTFNIPQPLLLLPQDLIKNIHVYLQLTTLEWVISAIYLLVFVTGVGGNFLVGYAVWRNKYLRTITNFFLSNLAVADFLTILICLPPSFAQTIFETWFLGNAMCKVVIYLQNVSVVVSVLTLTSISIERWFAICKPLTFQQTKARVVACITTIWLVANLTSIPRLFIMEEIHDDMFPPNITILLTTCAPRDVSFARKYEIFLIVAFFAFPIVVMGYNYTAIAMCLWSSSKSSKHLTEDADQQAIVSQLMARRRTAKMLVVVVVVFFLCFLPNYVWNILRHSKSVNLSSINESVPAITLITQLLVYANSCTNPIIYNFMSGKFRKEFRSACVCCSQCCRRQKSPASHVHEMAPLSSKRFFRATRYFKSVNGHPRENKTFISEYA